jgi:hypothetical protein
MNPINKFAATSAIMTALALSAVPVVASAADLPKAVQILFETPHIASVTPGTELVYKFERKPSDEHLLGKGFSDDIKVKIESDGAPGKKNIVLQIYSGDRARDPQRITDMDGNPMLVVYLDGAIAHFGQLAGGDRAYLKNKFSKTIGDDAKIDPVKIDYKGLEIEGYKVSVTPYANDPSRSKMRGFEGATFTIAVSDKIPGYFAQMVSKYSNSDKAAPYLEETTTLDGVTEVK